MRVLQVMAGAAHGGAEEFFVRLSVALAEAGIETRAVIRPFAARGATLRAGGVTVAELPFGGWFDFRTGPRLAAEIDAFHPDVVLSWMNRATGFVPRPQAGRARGFVHVGRLGGYYALKYYRHCDHLIGNTRGIVAHLVQAGWPAERAHYLPNFASETPAPPVSRASFQTPAEAPLFLALGRLHRNKGFDVLLDALAQVPGAFLWLAGEGPLRQSLTARAARLGLEGRVRFLGWRQDVAALLAAADALVCPSRHEPLGNVVLEAWAHRLPVIAAAADGPAELIEDGHNGLLVARDDAAALAAAMAQLAADAPRAASLAQAGHATYLLQFSKQTVVQRYRDLFGRLVAERIPVTGATRAVTDSPARG